MSFATQMASHGKDSAKACVSGLRFRRLIQNKSQEDLFGPLVRIIHLLGNKGNVKDLSEKLYWWNDHARRDWAFEYYGKAPTED
jgi:CRISPR system Cascade subunit CasB